MNVLELVGLAKKKVANHLLGDRVDDQVHIRVHDTADERVNYRVPDNPAVVVWCLR